MGIGGWALGMGAGTDEKIRRGRRRPRAHSRIPRVSPWRRAAPSGLKCGGDTESGVGKRGALSRIPRVSPLGWRGAAPSGLKCAAIALVA